MRRGEIYSADIWPRSGSEQSGVRPAIIISNDGFNKVHTWRSIIVVPLSTSGNQARRGPTAVFLTSADTGLAADGVALCHQVTTLDRSKLTARIGKLSTAALARVEDGLRAVVDLS